MKERKNVIQLKRAGSPTFSKETSYSDEWFDLVMGEWFPDFAQTIAREHFIDSLPAIDEFIEPHHIAPHKKDTLRHNLFWCRMNYVAFVSQEWSYIDDYIEANADVLSEVPPSRSWLKEWTSIAHRFYFVGSKLSDRVLVLVDMITEQPVDVVVCDPHAVTPVQGSIVAGALVPLGDDLYFPIVDFYHFEYEARRPLGIAIRHYYPLYEKTTPHETFMDVLSIALQIEHKVCCDGEKE
ncbi:hypothetical protein LCM20_16140 [Halobacillus litoralis]|uniref:hypothetical protein n=1 Tax=Halobacillus litoralis TaxID=45668 RepID=UPI001CD28C6D|nr:hypothetical protein [Halobacillus litoralis]MCA0972138.1 hypothetical protein [Halobacillus litoralis]